MNSTSTIHPRRSDCPGCFRSAQSMRTSFKLARSLAREPRAGSLVKMYPLYGKHFTQPPSLQPKLFLGCNPICLIFKVLRQDGFLFVRGRLARFPRQFMNPVRSSGCRPLLIRSHLLYNALYLRSMKILLQNGKDSTDKLSRRLSSRLLSFG